jgi:hypothetical protein
MEDKMDSEHKQYWLKQKSIHSGQFDNLVQEDNMTRIWVSRCETGDDGKPLVTIEHLIDGCWKVTDSK